MAEYDKGRYYWIKLTDRFMTSDTVDFLMSQKDGANYVVLYQMLCLKTVNNGGVMARQIGEMIVPYDVDKIQRDCKWFSVDTVRIALELYKRLGLIYESNEGILAISDFDRMVGSQTFGAEKKELQKARGGTKVENFPPEKEIKRLRDKDIDKDIDIHIDNNMSEKREDVSQKPAVSTIFCHWNEANIIKHRELTPDIAKAIEKALKVFTEDEIKTYIDRYAKVIGDASYFWHYKWRLVEFLSRKDGISSFTDEGSKWVNYQEHLAKPRYGRAIPKDEGKWHRSPKPTDNDDGFPF